MEANYGKLQWKLVYIICISFFLFLVAIHFNNRINNSDDFFFLTRLRELGFWKSITEWQYNQRPVSHFVFNLTFFLNTKIETLKWSLFIANICLVTSFIHSLKLIVSKLFLQIELQLEHKKLWAIATVLAMCYFFFCIERSEVWFWYICTTIYLLPFVLLNYGLVLMLEKKKCHLLSIVFFILIGGTLELMIPIVGTLLLVFFLNKKISFTTLLINGCALLFFSFFQLYNKGVENRMQIETMAFTEYNSTFASTFRHLFDKKNAFFILLVISITMLLRTHKVALSKIKFDKILIWLAGLLIAYFLITWFISDFVFAGSFGVLRMWAPFIMFLMVFIIISALWISLNCKKVSALVGVFASLLFIGMFAYFSMKQFVMTSKYARKYDLIVAGKSNEEVSPDSGILVSTGDFKLLKEYLVDEAMR